MFLRSQSFGKVTDSWRWCNTSRGIQVLWSENSYSALAGDHCGLAVSDSSYWLRIFTLNGARSTCRGITKIADCHTKMKNNAPLRTALLIPFFYVKNHTANLLETCDLSINRLSKSRDSISSSFNQIDFSDLPFTLSLSMVWACGKRCWLWLSCKQNENWLYKY